MLKGSALRAFDVYVPGTVARAGKAGLGVAQRLFYRRVLKSDVSGNGNTAVGADALFSDASGQANTAIGAGALFSNIGGPFPGSFNTAVGYNTLLPTRAGTTSLLALRHSNPTLAETTT